MVQGSWRLGAKLITWGWSVESSCIAGGGLTAVLGKLGGARCERDGEYWQLARAWLFLMSNDRGRETSLLSLNALGVT